MLTLSVLLFLLFWEPFLVFLIDLEGEAFVVKNSKRGYLEFKPFFKDLNKESLFYYSRFLIRGINDLCFEYPNDIKLVLEEN